MTARFCGSEAVTSAVYIYSVWDISDLLRWRRVRAVDRFAYAGVSLLLEFRGSSFFFFKIIRAHYTKIGLGGPMDMERIANT